MIRVDNLTISRNDTALGIVYDFDILVFLLTLFFLLNLAESTYFLAHGILIFTLLSGSGLLFKTLELSCTCFRNVSEVKVIMRGRLFLSFALPRHFTRYSESATEMFISVKIFCTCPCSEFPN